MTSHAPRDGSFKTAFVLLVCSALHGNDGQSCSPGRGLGPTDMVGRGHDRALRACEPGHRHRGSGPLQGCGFVLCVPCQELAFLPVPFISRWTRLEGERVCDRVPAPGDVLGAERRPVAGSSGGGGAASGQAARGLRRWV